MSIGLSKSASAACRFKDRFCRIVGFPLGDAQPCGFRQPGCDLSRCHLSFPLRFVDCRKTLPHALSISVVGDEESRQASDPRSGKPAPWRILI
jgi:hypothetical protein